MEAISVGRGFLKRRFKMTTKLRRSCRKVPVNVNTFFSHVLHHNPQKHWDFMLTPFFWAFTTSTQPLSLHFNIMPTKTDWDEHIDRPRSNPMSRIPKHPSAIHPYPSEARRIQYRVSLRYWAIYSSWIEYRRWWDPVNQGRFLMHTYLSVGLW